MEWSIQDVARQAGTTSRTLRHYGEIGLLPPSRVGDNGYRYYDRSALIRLQRILLLRELGLGLPAIAEVLAGQRDESAALRTHLRLLEQERDRIGRQIESVRTTLRKTEEGEDLMAEEIFDGFDHTRYEEEVVERWGRDAYDSADRWWRSLGEEERKTLQRREADIAGDYGRAAGSGVSPSGEEAQEITRRHYTWLSEAGTPPSKEYFTGLAEMYVADPRFTVHYDRYGEGTAEFVRDAMKVYAERHLGD
ncbi:MerR family transcriptional regulator [Streptomyces zingiberis]|uniref:MerR family transcriptional regulator n=1 Tax=Streptomyces zingiberis TaxID=2053010 RepID=A0ABX1C6I2_9ACTN|nr:TipAS antibiotic-recognition domain-containing protein [Streptomyces zingiberis]NJQ03537.1 MerR family transcriptional regulator [Streptomyces zingiberis]